MIGQPTSSQFGQSLQKSYTLLGFWLVLPAVGARMWALAPW
jgi:hypothetical protein